MPPTDGGAQRESAAHRDAPLRVAVLAKGWTGYHDAAFRALAARGVELLVVHPDSMSDTGFAQYDMSAYARQERWAPEQPPEAESLVRVVDDFAPDAVLMMSWESKPYRAVMTSRPPGTLRVLWMDNVWRSTPKQWFGRAVHPVYLRPVFDLVLVPGDRTEFFARRLGFGSDRVLRGGLTADTDLFGSGERTPEELGSRRRFVAALRLVHHKGADHLAEAYCAYRDLVDDPWELHVVGMGPLEHHLAGIEGVVLHGFLQPDELAALMHRSSCLVNPARIEPYAVVLHEGAAAGLALLTTDRVGAGPALVQDGSNGWVVRNGRPALLAEAMARMSTQTPERLAEMSSVSRSLAARLSPRLWARNLDEELSRRLATGASGRRR